MLAGARLYPQSVREDLLVDDERLLCAAKRTVLDTAVVGVTEYYNVSVCLLFHTMGWQGLFDSCCGQGLQQGLQCLALTDKLTANVRDVRSQTKVASATSHAYADRWVFVEKGPRARTCLLRGSLWVPFPFFHCFAGRLPQVLSTRGHSHGAEGCHAARL